MHYMYRRGCGVDKREHNILNYIPKKEGATIGYEECVEGGSHISYIISAQ